MPRRPWEINSEIGDMKGELLVPTEHKADRIPFLSFVRYDTRLELPWLTTMIGQSLKQTMNEGFIEGLKQLDRPHMMEQMYDVGSLAAEKQVTLDDFPERFDPQPLPQVPVGTFATKPGAMKGIPLFTIQTTGRLRKRRRLIARRVLAAADFRAIAVKVGTKPIKARRVGLLAARRAEAEEEVVTRWNGEESRNKAAPGDWIVTNLTPQGQVLRDRAGQANTYVIRAARFPELYEPHVGETELGAVYKPKGTVDADALHFSAGFELLAPWGEKQQADDGYLLLHDTEVYGNNRATFEATYEIVH
jgi:hypothetical protein